MRSRTASVALVLSLASGLSVLAVACESPTEPPADPNVCAGTSYSPAFLPAGVPAADSRDDFLTQTPPLFPVYGCSSFVLRLEMPDFDPRSPATTFWSVGAVVDGAYHGALSRSGDGPATLSVLLNWTVVPLTGGPMIVGPDNLTLRARAAWYAPPDFNSLLIARDSIEFPVSVIPAGDPLPLVPDTVVLVLRRTTPD